MLKNFLSFSRLILHEVQNKKQRFWSLVEEAPHSGEKLSNAELKITIFDKIPPETAATLRNKQSEDGVKTWWAEVGGFDASANMLLVREALQKCSPTSVLKMKFTEDQWKIKFHEHEDRDVFVQFLNRGVSFHGQRLRARNYGVFRTFRRNSGKGLSASLMLATKITMRASGGNKNS